LCLGAFFASPACAQPDLSIAADTQLLRHAPAAYVFETLTLSAQADGTPDERRYRVYLGIPRKAPPPAGYPVFYALDGNAVLDALHAQESLLEETGASASPPLLVLIGYDTQARFDVIARTYDYTPPIPVSAKANLEDPSGSERKTGGADSFREFIETRLKPELRQKMHLNSQQQTLWGHSYGGLFVLHTLFAHPEDFQHYIAVSPSLWWQEGRILREAETFFATTRMPSQALTLLALSGADEAGEKKRQSENATQAGIQQARPPQRGTVPKDSLFKLIERLNAQNKLSARLILHEGKTHGEMFHLGLKSALRLYCESGE
jgi:predicted alpha/beta superfamily hydrolase